jgi:hypothetical protein
MWRIVLPLLQFAMECWLGLGAFTVLAAIVLAVGAGLAHRPVRRIYPSIF